MPIKKNNSSYDRFTGSLAAGSSLTLATGGNFYVEGMVCGTGAAGANSFIRLDVWDGSTWIEVCSDYGGQTVTQGSRVKAYGERVRVIGGGTAGGDYSLAIFNN